MPVLRRALLVPLTRLIRAAPVGDAGPRRGPRVTSAGSRGWIMLVVAASALVFSAPRAGAQIAYTRFDITSVDDTTFTFAAAGVEWLKRSQEGLVVDPTHGDELIAKFRVLRVHNGTATAVVTGQTARLAGSYVALLSEPHHPFYTRPWFWIAVAVGGAIGYVVHR